MAQATPPRAARAVTAASYDLAEGPVWDRARRRLLWVDITAGLVVRGRLGPDRVDVEAEHRFAGHVGAVALADDGSLLVVETRRLTRLDPDGGRTSTGPLDAVGPHERLNDATCDARGRLLVGTLSLAGDHRAQRLLQVGPEGVRVLDDDLGLSNGLAFSPDGGTLYSVDSRPGTVWRRDYDHDTGATGPRRRLLDLRDETPDGLAVDDGGRLWVAMWGSAEVRCYDPDGGLQVSVAVPAPHVSSVAFVGDGLDRLVVTTARSELTDRQLAEHPLSGSLFVADPGRRGLPPYAWSGVLPDGAR